MTPSENPSSLATSPSTPWHRIGLFVCLAASAGTGMTYLLEQSHRQSFPGALEGRKTVIAAHCAARVHEISVRTGQSVSAGDPLCQLIDGQLEDRLASKRRAIVEYDAEVARSKAAADMELAWRRRELQAEIFETQLKVAALSQEKLNKQVEQIAWKERLSTNDSNMGPLLAEASHPFRSVSVDLHLPDDRRLQAMLREDAAAATAETLAIQITLCEQRLKNLESLEKDLATKIRTSSGVDVAEARLNSSKQELAELESQIKELTMTSPAYGKIGDVKLQRGDRVPSGSTVIEIFDDQEPHVVAQIPSSSAARVRVGSKVTLLFPMNEKRLGMVVSIPPQTIPVPGTSESFLAVKIEPAGKLWPKVAMGSNVKVQLY